ncbi:MAG: hypothetical protein K0R00_51 [Herbinix sp.]|jgi:hypothetical protein|nr:hypothetical protein [Herbinix sp.]
MKLEEFGIQAVLEVKRIRVTPCYESKWEIMLKLDDSEKVYGENIKNHGYVEIYKGKAIVGLTRLDTETQEKMEDLVHMCKTVKEVCDLYFEVYYD